MSDVEIKRWENEFLGIKVWMIRVGKDFYFFGKELASELGYADPAKTIQNRIVNPEEKPTMREILGSDYRKILKQVLTNSDLDKISRSYTMIKGFLPNLHFTFFVEVQRRKKQNHFKNGSSTQSKQLE